MNRDIESVTVAFTGGKTETIWREGEWPTPRPKRIPDEIRVQDYFPDDRYEELIHGEADATEYIQAAIDAAWEIVKVRYKRFKPKPGVGYPNWQGSETAWGASQVAVAPPVVLPAGVLRVDGVIELPACVPLVSPHSTFAGSTIEFGVGGQLLIDGNLLTEFGPLQMLRGQVSGIKFVSGGKTPVVLCGHVANFRFFNNHIHCLGKDDISAIHHADHAGEPTIFGKILGARGQGAQTLKEVVIADNQIEGPKGGNAIDISGAFDCQINNNLILYAGLGIRAANCDRLTIQGNRINGDRPGEPIQVGDQAGIIASGKYITAVGNSIDDMEFGIGIYGKDNHAWLNDWTRVDNGANGTNAVLPAGWKCPGNFGSFKKGASAPYFGG